MPVSVPVGFDAEQVLTIVRAREQARQARNFGLADQLRGELQSLGLRVEDGRGSSSSSSSSSTGERSAPPTCAACARGVCICTTTLTVVAAGSAGEAPG